MNRSFIRSAFASTILFAVDSAAGNGAAVDAVDAPTDAPVVDETESTETETEVNPAHVAIPILTDSTKVEAISKAMRQREVFPTLAAAIAKLQKAAEDTDAFYGLPIAIKGANDDGSIDESIYEGAGAALAYVGARVDDNKGKKIPGVKGVVIFPIPTVDSFLAGGEAAINWIAKLVEKEAALVAFRGYRESASLAEFQNGVQSSPASVDEYVTEYSRSGSSLDTETFDALWNGLRLSLKTQQPILSKLIPAKAEVLKAIRSSAYASAEYGPLEEKGIFAKLANILIDVAKNNTTKDGTSNPLPTKTLEDWLAGRDTLTLTKATADAPDYSALEALNW